MLEIQTAVQDNENKHESIKQNTSSTSTLNSNDISNSDATTNECQNTVDDKFIKTKSGNNIAWYYQKFLFKFS